jgi:hypothetical protein
MNGVCNTSPTFFHSTFATEDEGRRRIHVRTCGSFSTLRPNFCYAPHTYEKKNSVAFSPQTNYTDWSTATCQRNLVPTFVDRGVSRGQRGGFLTVVNISFIDRSRNFPFK